MAAARRQCVPWLVLAAVSATVGCGDSGDLSYAPAAGIVTIDGKPVDGAQVILLMDVDAIQGPKPTSRGVTDANGRFVLKTLTPDKKLVDGAVVGQHRVRIITRIVEQDSQGNTRVVREEKLPSRYTEGQEFTVDIPSSGDEVLRFDIASAK